MSDQFTKEDINFGLRIIALEDLIRKIYPSIDHDHERVAVAGNLYRWQCKSGCRKCLAAAAIGEKV